jgi:SH3 domain protein
MRIVQRIGIKLIVFSFMIFPFTVSVGLVYAEKRYVTDQLVITLREGKGNEYKIIKTLKTGTHLEILEESEQHFKVRTDAGIEGWVLKQYVTKKIPKPEIIAGLENKVEQLSTEVAQYKKDNESLQDELKTAKSDYNSKMKDLQQNVSSSRGKAEQTDRALKEMSEKYNTLFEQSKDVVNLIKEHDSLKASYSSLQTKTEQLREANEELKQSQMIWWFVAGGGVLFVGWIIGKMSRQKRFY